jgi:hypothetical protein
LYERFGVFFSGASYTLYGEPGLRPDRSSSIDAGIDQTLWSSRVQLSTSYFYTRLNEVIIFDTTGAITPLTDPLGRNGGYRNTGGGIARGVEFSSNVAAKCIGYVSGFPAEPELETHGWERRESLARLIHFDRFGSKDEQRSSRLLEARRGKGHS